MESMASRVIRTTSCRIVLVFPLAIPAGASDGGHPKVSRGSVKDHREGLGRGAEGDLAVVSHVEVV